MAGIHTDMEEVILDETMVSALMGNKDMKAAKRKNKKQRWKSARPARKP